MLAPIKKTRKDKAGARFSVNSILRLYPHKPFLSLLSPSYFSGNRWYGCQ